MSGGPKGPIVQVLAVAASSPVVKTAVPLPAVLPPPSWLNQLRVAVHARSAASLADGVASSAVAARLASPLIKVAGILDLMRAP